MTTKSKLPGMAVLALALMLGPSLSPKVAATITPLHNGSSSGPDMNFEQCVEYTTCNYYIDINACAGDQPCLEYAGMRYEDGYAFCVEHHYY